MSFLLSCKNSEIAIELMNKLKNVGIETKIIPTPSALNVGCGLSLLVKSDEEFNKIDKHSDKFDAYQIITDLEKTKYKKV